MVSIRFLSFVLVFILVPIGESSAQSQVMETVLAADGNGLEPARKNLSHLGKEAYEVVPAAVEVGNSRLEGRKMMLKWDLDKKTVSVKGSDGEESEKISDNPSAGKSSHRGKGLLNVNCKLRNRNPHRHRKGKITGKVTNALNNQIGSSQEKFKNQDDTNMLKANFLYSASPESDKLPSTNQLCSRYSKPVSNKGSSECFSRTPKLVLQESDNNFLQKLQSQKLLGAIKELINFMNEDYQKPPTKPPVHNKAPLDREQAIP
ncbi:hypothetical protein CRYUN_Cryun19dG0025600 [Craigia yunnanensis]